MEAALGSNASPAPADSRSPEAESHKSFTKHVPSKRNSVFAAAAALGVLTMTAFLVFLHKNHVPGQESRSSFCCPDVLQDLYSAANLTIDPCRSFFDHTCYALVTETGDRPGRANLNTDPIDGFPKTEAGRAVAAYYRACVLSPGDSKTVGRACASAIATAGGLPKNASVTSHDLLALLIDLSLKYGLPSVIEFGVGAGPNLVPYLNVSPSGFINTTEDLSADILDAMKRDAVLTVNEAFSYNVSITDMDRLVNESTKMISEATEKYKFDSVTKFTPDVSTEQWKQLVDKFNVTVYDVFSIPRPALEDLLTGVFRPEKRQIAVASALVGASLKLASRVIIGTNNSEIKKIACRSRAKQLRPLWILDSIQLLKSDSLSQDAAINKAYSIVADTVLQKARTGMQADDFQKLYKTFKEMRLQLPSEIVPAGLPIPNMTLVYAEAELVTRAYLLQAQRHWTFTLAASEDLLEEFETGYATINDNMLTVPTLVYRLHSLTRAAEPMLLMSTVGAHLADSLWKHIFTSMWSNVTNATLQAYRDCIVKNSWPVVVWPSRLLWLSVQTSLEACKEVDWDYLVDTNIPLRVSNRQLFYMIFVHYSMCHSPQLNYPTFPQDVDVAMYGLKDFSHSYHCDVTASKTGDMCSL